MTLTVAAHREADGGTRIVLTGEVDLATVASLDRAVTEALDDEATSHVLIDLDGLTFLDSTGISALLKGRREADARAKGYRAVGAHGTVLQILEVTGVWNHLADQPA